jgi:simple sugar transport system ATP-binding protein
MTTKPAQVLELRSLAKSFGAVRALDGVSFGVGAGEVVALIGDNGAGKSTLVKCISGLHQPDAGEILIDGVDQHFSSPQQARECGVETVYQHLSLIDPFNISENFFLGRELYRGPRRLRILDKRRMATNTAETLDRLHIRIPSAAVPVSALSGGQRQAVAVARAVAWGRHIVLLDEPTAALGVEQSEQVLQLIARLADEGVAVIVISHNMHDVLRCSDRVVVLRRGSLVGDVRSDAVSEHDLVTMITGGTVDERATASQGQPTTPVT